MSDFTLAGVTVSPSPNPVRISGETFTAGMQDGTARAYSVKIPDGGILEVASVSWDSGDRDVRAMTRLAGPSAYDRLVKGLRLGIGSAAEDRYFCELGITQIHEDRQPTVVKAEAADHTLMLGADVREMFVGLGAAEYGTREVVLNDTSRRRTYLAVTFPKAALDVPVAAFVLTRVLPLMKGFGRKGVIPVGRA